MFIPCIVYEMNKFFQLKFLQVYTPPMYNLACLGKLYIFNLFLLSSECCNKDYKDYQLMSDPKMNKYLFQIIYTFLYVVQFVLSMFVVGKVIKRLSLILSKMLIIMTFNVQYFASVTAGLAIAHFTWNILNCSTVDKHNTDGKFCKD